MHRPTVVDSKGHSARAPQCWVEFQLQEYLNAMYSTPATVDQEGPGSSVATNEARMDAINEDRIWTGKVLHTDESWPGSV